MISLQEATKQAKAHAPQTLKEALVRRVVQMETASGQVDIATRFILKHGKEMQHRPFAGLRGPPKNCFMNATTEARKDAQFVYVEGYAASRTIGHIFEHGWLTRQPSLGFAFDPTLTNPENYAYFGVALSRTVVQQVQHRTGNYSVIFGAPPEVLLEIDPSFVEQIEAGKIESARAHETFLTAQMGVQR